MTSLNNIGQGFTANLGGVYSATRQSPFSAADPIVPKTDPRSQNSISLALGSAWSTNAYNGIRNAFDYLNMLQVAEYGVDRISSNLDAMHQLATKSADDSTTDSERSDLDKDYGKLLYDIDDIVRNTTFGNRELLDGSVVDSGGRGLHNLYTEALGLRNPELNDVLSQEKAELVTSSIQSQAQRYAKASRDWLHSEKTSVQDRIHKLQDEAAKADGNPVLDQRVAFESMSWLKDQLVNQFTIAVPMQATRVSDNAPSLIRQTDAAVSATVRSTAAAQPGLASTTAELGSEAIAS